MSVRKTYSCDLCGSHIDDTCGIAIIHQPKGEITAAYLANEGAGRHLCNRCVRGLRSLLADLDRTSATQAEMDEASNA